MSEDSTNLTGVGLLFLACMGVLLWVLPRRHAVVPLLITTCYMPLGQMVVVGGLHFQLFRILLLVGVCRLLVRNEGRGLEFTYPDKLFLYWAVVTLVMGAILGHFINRSGEIYDALGAYFLFRCWIRDLDDLVGLLRFLGWMILVLGVFMMVEKSTHRNIFAIFGGVPEITGERDGKLRCQGAFRHPILAGTYAATLFPLFVGLWFQRGRSKGPAVVGVCSSMFATMAANSSGALLAMIAALVGFALWGIRDQMRLFRRATLFTLIILHFVIMKAPVWYLISKISDIFGGSGWHRSYLIDQAVKHFNEWWLIGSSYTAHWAPGGGALVLIVDPNNMDITNQYVAEGLGGGVLKLGLFVAIIVQGFKTVGRRIHSPNATVSQQILLWSLGVTLTAHCMSFLSVSYFDQIIVMWYWLLAVLSTLAAKGVWTRHGQSRSSAENFTPEPLPVPVEIFS